MSNDSTQLKNIIEAALLAADQPLSIDRLLRLFDETEQPSRDALRAALTELEEDCAQRGVEVKEVSSGFRMQVKANLGKWVARLWEEKPPRYTRALLETLALIAYKQPITRAEVEDVRGVSVSTNIIKTLQEREWIRVVGHREVPGKPALYGTTREFLDYFNLASLEELPPLADIRNLDEIKIPAELEETLAAIAAEQQEIAYDEASNDEQPADEIVEHPQLEAAEEQIVLGDVPLAAADPDDQRQDNIVATSDVDRTSDDDLEDAGEDSARVSSASG